MSSTTVAEFATELKKSPDTLLEQLRSAGVAKAASTDALSEADKQKLLGYLQASHGTATAGLQVAQELLLVGFAQRVARRGLGHTGAAQLLEQRVGGLFELGCELSDGRT